MAYRDKEKQKEYQRQYYWNRTKLKRKVKPAKSYNKYEKKTEAEKAENRRIGAIKRKATMLAKYGGEEGYREHLRCIGKRAQATLRANGTPIGFQAGYGREASLAGAKIRGLKSKHKVVRERWQENET